MPLAHCSLQEYIDSRVKVKKQFEKVALIELIHDISQGILYLIENKLYNNLRLKASNVLLFKQGSDIGTDSELNKVAKV